MSEVNQLWLEAQPYYRRVFYTPWGKTWYASVMKPIALSAEENEKLLSSRELEQPTTVDEWHPYELIIETQIGLALVLSQAYITDIVSQIHNLHNDYRVAFEKDLNGFRTTRSDLLKHSISFYKNTKHTKVEAIDHLANYFKHHQEWGGGYRQLSPNAKRTAGAAKELGLKVGWSLWLSRNLTNAVRPLGISAPNELPILLSIIDEWKGELGLAYQSVLN